MTIEQGVSLIATAISKKGIEVPEDPTIAELVDKIQIALEPTPQVPTIVKPTPQVRTATAQRPESGNVIKCDLSDLKPGYIGSFHSSLNMRKPVPNAQGDDKVTTIKMCLNDFRPGSRQYDQLPVKSFQ